MTIVPSGIGIPVSFNQQSPRSAILIRPFFRYVKFPLAYKKWSVPVPEGAAGVKDNVILSCVGISIETDLCNINIPGEGPSVELFNISKKIFKLQPFSIYSPMNHRIKNECVIGTW